TIGSGATLNGAAHNLTLQGNWTNSGSFVPATGAVLATGTGKTISGNTTFNKLTVYGSYALSAADITVMSGLTVLTGATYAAGPNTNTLYGDFYNGGSVTGSGVTTFVGDQVQTISLINALVNTSTGVVNFNGSKAPVLNSTSTPTFATVNINNTAGLSPSVGWTVLVAANIAANSAFHGGVSTHNFSGAFTNNGIVTSSGTLQFTPPSAKTVALGSNSTGNTFSSTGTVLFGGSGALSVTGTPTALNNVVIANTQGVSPSANWSGISGTFTISSNAVFNAGSYSYTLNGNMESDGTLNGGSSLFTFTSATAQISGSPDTRFYDVLVSGALTVNSEFGIDHDLTMNGTVDASLAGIEFTGTPNGQLTGAATTLTLAELDVRKTSGSVFSLQRNIAGVGDLSINSGTLDAGAFAITQDASSSSNFLYIEDGARLRIGGSNTVPVFSLYSFDSLSTVEYYGGTQAIATGTPYGHLEITAGAKTVAAPLTIQKNVLISGGSFAAGAFTHSVGGNWTQTGGTFTGTGSTIVFNGLTGQTVAAISPFHHLTLNNASGLSLAGAATVNGTLAFTLGKLTLGSYDLALGSSAVLSGYTSGKYVVATGSGFLRQPLGAGATRVFPVGSATDYLPATVAFTAGSTPDNISVRLRPAAYTNGETGSVKTSSAVAATWLIEEGTAGGSDASITLQWPGSLELGGFVRGTARLAHYTGTAWDYGAALAASGSDPYSVTRSGFTTFSPFSVRMYASTLPVTWLSFTGTRTAGTDRLDWRTATESGSSHFEVEESSNGSTFSAVGRVAAAGNSSTVRAYHFERGNASGTRYYRLRQVDLDGRSSYSAIVRLGDAATAFSAALAANPVRSGATLRLATGSAQPVQLLLHDAGGRLLWSTSIAAAQGTQSIALPLEDKAAGVYFLTLTGADGSRQALQLVKE
ncbi:MAG: T9SS type A sorting domain-containing protein, partial [Rubrivivax sp.]